MSIQIGIDGKNWNSTQVKDMVKIMNLSSREIYIVGAFDCGCNYEAGFGSVEIVRCSNTSELNDIKKRMNKHSADYQCDFRHALCLLVFEGKAKFLKGCRIVSYKGYVRTWNARNNDGRKKAREMEKFDTVFNRQCKWMQREKVHQDKITAQEIAQETANTGCGVT